jgi:anaerobic selenocysteine-containing dehydrogenase
VKRQRRQKIKPDLNRGYFGGCAYEAIDWQNAAIYVIPKIFEIGTKTEVDEMVRFYGKTKIMHITRHSLPFLSLEVVRKIAGYFQLPEKLLAFPVNNSRLSRKQRTDIELAKNTSEFKRVPNLFRGYFWEFNFDEINWERAYVSVIDRVAERGNDQDYEEIIRFYGREKVIHTLRNEVVYMHEYVIEKVCVYFGFRQEELLCFWRRYTRPGPRFMPNEDAVYLPQIKFLSA